MLAIEAAFPQLHELHLAGNSISNLQPDFLDLPSPCFRSLQVGPQHCLRTSCSCSHAGGCEPSCADTSTACGDSHVCAQVLDLDDNQLSEWADVQTLSRLPSLQRLSLTGNSIDNISTTGQLLEAGFRPIVSICCGAMTPRSSSLVCHRGCPMSASWRAGGGEGGFPALQALLLGDNAIASWATVDALMSFPSLREARLSGNAGLGDDQTRVRSEVLCIARMLSAGLMTRATFARSCHGSMIWQELLVIGG